MDIVTGLTAVSTALSVLKDLRSIDAQYDAADFKLKVAELAGALADAKLALIEAQQNLSDARAEAKRLRDAFAYRGSILEVHGHRYEAVKGDPVGYPFCNRCDVVDGMLVRLTRHGPYGQGQCPQCKSVYQDLKIYGYPSSPSG